MNLGQALILSIVIAVIILENYGYGYWMISRPVMAGPIIGLIMGDLQTGLLVGASVELMYMGVLPIGGSVPPNAQIAGMLSTVFAITNGGRAEIGISLALPIGILAQLLIMFAWNINIGLMHRADKYIAEGNIKKIERTHLLGLPIFFLVFFIPTFLAIYLGSDAVTSVVNAMPAILTDGLKVASGILPAVGMAMLLKMMNFKKYWSFFIFGFILAVYLNLNVLAISLIAFCLVMAFATLGQRDTAFDDFDDFDDATDESKEKHTLIDNHVLKGTFVRSFFSMTSINYERYTSLGFCYAMIPTIKKLYDKPEDQIAALKRHNEFFNCYPYTGNAVMGVSIALEESLALGTEGVNSEAISATKSALMGPLSGIGDSVFKAVFMTIFAAIGAGMAMEGNVIGPIIFIVPNVTLNVLSRWYFIKYGYEFGSTIIMKMRGSQVIDKFIEGATVVGLMVVGAMSVSFVKVPVALTWNFGEIEIVLLDLINSIVPGILSLLLVLGFYKILTKQKRGMFTCIVLSFIIGIAGKVIGLF
ncbi:PTS mannose/fructose/sorbose family IID subunit [Erysipelothrix sp. HDW6C]|uniref:PTS system mannose/fructose/sorbose family transporter subunit IID n=1 Tax=Erysipelothrix sp. HDW6C TaxID=2714930 RepID=UPI0014091956|nr:PTS system mannose/fructose/sorbose family transporter subunit IID [Erysipelothrix sp. HDW6C]QIK69841.1 PTS mannose/fructose/sorbose family IID subunit [Erysipelothrix sp. HDW6C]